jgi:hypothetical protein
MVRSVFAFGVATKYEYTILAAMRVCSFCILALI